MEDTRFTWNKAFQEALDHDTWGQVEEAVNGYQRLQVAAAVEHVENVLDLPGHRRQAIGQLANILKLRIQELNAGVRGSVGLPGMQALKPFMAGLIVSDVCLPPALAAVIKAAPLPAVVAAAGDTDSKARNGVCMRSSMRGSVDNVAVTIYNPNDEMDSIAEVTSRLSVTGQHAAAGAAAAAAAAAVAAADAGTLRPPPDDLQPGDTTLSIDFATLSVKGAAAMADPRIIVRVRDKAGKLLEAVQESPAIMCFPTDPDKFSLGFSWHMQTPLNCLPDDAAVFFELQHYKLAKKKKSIKCYSYLEGVELEAAGGAVLEVYRKPVDAKRKARPTLLTSKPMYLHITRRLVQH